MASLFPARVAQGFEAGTYVKSFTPGTGASEPFIPGDLVAWDTTDGTMDRCGTDPTTIAGIAEGDSTVAIYPDGKVPVRILTGASVVLALSSTTTPVEATHVGKSYGVTRASGGQWQLDISKTTTSSRARVVGVDAANGIFYCVLHQNLLQFADLTVATA